MPIFRFALEEDTEAGSMTKFMPYFVCIANAYHQSRMEKESVKQKLEDHILRQR